MSYVIKGHLVATLHRTTEFRSGDHVLLMGEGREDIQQQYAEAAETSLVEARAATFNPYTRRLGRIQRTGVWL